MSIDEALMARCQKVMDTINKSQGRPYANVYTIPSESDPNGLSAHTPGAKLDAGKPRPWLVLGGFNCALMEVAKVGTMGAEKYSDDGWKMVEGGQRRYLDAAFRHLLAGDECDSQSGLDHLAHAAWNLLAVLQLKIETPVPPDYVD